jgi:hypothetical protein
MQEANKKIQKVSSRYVEAPQFGKASLPPLPKLAKPDALKEREKNKFYNLRIQQISPRFDAEHRNY